MNEMTIKGKIWKYGDNIDTDVLYPARYLVFWDPAEIVKHAMEGLDKDFIKEVQKGDIVIGGKNFGCGSAREQAASALQYAGVGAVIAESFARSFYRNAINNGLFAITLKGVTEKFEKGDLAELNIEESSIANLTRGIKLQIEAPPEFILKIVRAGGAVPFYKEKIQKVRSHK